MVRFELYDLSLDPAQSYDLSGKELVKFEELKGRMRVLWKGIQEEAPDWMEKVIFSISRPSSWCWI